MSIQSMGVLRMEHAAPEEEEGERMSAMRIVPSPTMMWYAK